MNMENRPKASLSDVQDHQGWPPNWKKKYVFILAHMIMIMFTKLHSVYLVCFIFVQVLYIFFFLDLLVFDWIKPERVQLISLQF